MAIDIDDMRIVIKSLNKLVSRETTNELESAKDDFDDISIFILADRHDIFSRDEIQELRKMEKEVKMTKEIPLIIKNAMSIIEERISRESNNGKKVEFIDYFCENIDEDLIKYIKDAELKLNATLKKEPKFEKKMEILEKMIADGKKIEGCYDCCRETWLSCYLVKKENETQKDIFLNCLKNNKKLADTIVIDFLDEKYIKLFGQEKFEQIACYGDMQRDICDLSESRFKLFKKCYSQYIDENGDKNWNKLTYDLVIGISGKKRTTDETGKITERRI